MLSFAGVRAAHRQAAGGYLVCLALFVATNPVRYHCAQWWVCFGNRDVNNWVGDRVKTMFQSNFGKDSA
jgi:hypothetical protein